jgi:predicted AAA+ superfamily ATPase
MNQEFLTKYVSNQIYRGGLVLSNKVLDSNNNEILPRYFYRRLKKYLNYFQDGSLDPRIIALSGLRGVGKTTLLAFLYFDLLQEETNKFFVSVDELVNLVNSNLYECLEEYQSQIGKRFDNVKERFYILIDEIHFDKNWVQTLKTVYDKYPNVFIVCTGSAALALNTSSDLARRVLIQKVHPLSFSEYIQLKTKSNKSQKTILPIKNISQELKDIFFNSSNVLEMKAKIKELNVELRIKEYFSKFDSLELEEYLKYGSMPNNLVFKDKDLSISFSEQLLERVVERDLVEFGNFESSTIIKAKSVLVLIAFGSSTSINSLSKNLDMDNTTINEVLTSLEKCELIGRILPFGNAEKKVRKAPQFYFKAPVFRYSLLKTLDGINTFYKYKGSLLEDLIAQTLYRELKLKKQAEIYNDPSSGNADFIISSYKQKIALEVGFGNKGMEQVKKSMDRFKLDLGIVVSQGQLHFWPKENIVRIPLNWFLLI